MNEGRIVSSQGLDISAQEFAAEFAEYQMPHSTALFCGRGAAQAHYLVGPLARVNLNHQRLAPEALWLAEELSLEWPCANPYRSIVARGLEIVHAYAEALTILKEYQRPRAPRVEVRPRQSSGAAATEAPRGMLYHRFELDAEGLVQKATIIPPTSQNQAQIEADLRSLVSARVARPDEQIARDCERLVRSYDPCISCSTHFLKLDLVRT